MELFLFYEAEAQIKKLASIGHFGSLAHSAQLTYCPQLHTIHSMVVILDKTDAIDLQLSECAEKIAYMMA